MRFIVPLLAISLLALLMFKPMPGIGQPDNRQNVEQAVLSEMFSVHNHVPQDEDSIARRDFMRAKLMYTQKIFAGLTIGDFEQIHEAVLEVKAITGGSQWVAIDNPEYKRLTEEFQSAAARLAEAAETENIDATALRYYNLATSCIDCHKHIRAAGYEW
ncbi:MAG TPA: hypothetical protein PKD64_11265 [Pirellulaceae bacterium]|nr:hypothetical protein [Pirellulaceae bacterium]HMO92761.1 hypothetical protein [Pirellulaceae bacterium]HMP69343.1 hypothetical protein [Pirellulaceae bacterium]